MHAEQVQNDISGCRHLGNGRFLRKEELRSEKIDLHGFQETLEDGFREENGRFLRKDELGSEQIDRNGFGSSCRTDSGGKIGDS